MLPQLYATGSSNLVLDSIFLFPNTLEQLFAVYSLRK